MPFNIPFCTITSNTSIELGNDKVSDGSITTPRTLVITSDNTSLYPITPNDFRVQGAIETSYTAPTYTTIQNNPEIESVTFTQSSAEVNVVVELVNTFAMNDLDQSINFCIEGSPSISATVTGDIFNVTTNQTTI